MGKRLFLQTIDLLNAKQTFLLKLSLFLKMLGAPFTNYLLKVKHLDSSLDPVEGKLGSRKGSNIDFFWRP